MEKATEKNRVDLGKIGFWSVFSLVVGSQIGSGIFTTPSHVAGFGLYAVIGFAVAALGAMALGLVFSELCAAYPNTGGPVVYIQRIFGARSCGVALAFFSGWTYWVISWVSTTAVVITAIGYLQSFGGSLQDPTFTLGLQGALLLSIMFLNMRGVQAAGHMETVLTALKIIPLLILPLIAFSYLHPEYFQIHSVQTERAALSAPLASVFWASSWTESWSWISRMALLALWGFIGLETATMPADSVLRPERTIPKAILWGTACVALIYLLNMIAIIGVVPAEVLAQSAAPYVTLCHYLFPGEWYKILSIVAFIVCVGTLNAWILSSGQMALGLACSGFLPAVLGRANFFGAPVWGIFFSTIGIFPLLWITYQGSFVEQLRLVIDVSVLSFVLIYLICSLAFLKHAFARGLSTWKKGVGFIAVLFCLWILTTMDRNSALWILFFVGSGLLVYIPMHCARHRNGGLIHETKLDADGPKPYFSGDKDGKGL